MCYLVRQQQPATEAGPAVQPPGSQGLGQRWAGATAFLLLGGLALAGALVTTPSQAPQVKARESGAPQPVAARTTQLPVGGGTTQEPSLQMDDGVPTGTDVSRAGPGIGHCHHGL